MENRNNLKILLCIIAVCIAAAGGFYAGRNTAGSQKSDTGSAAQKDSDTEPNELQLLNREAVSHMSDEGNTILVIGHKSPDSDTVCSAIAYV